MADIGATNPRAARLRHDATECERRLWEALRNRQLGGFKFRRQATVGSYVADLLCVSQRLVIEVDGGQHNLERDAERSAFLIALGYRVLRFWNHEVVQNFGGVLDAINLALKEEERPSPNPPPHAGEG